MGLWTLGDIAIHKKMARHCVLEVDSTDGIAVLINNKEGLFYYNFSFYNREVHTEVSPFSEILTDKPDEQISRLVFSQYLESIGKAESTMNFIKVFHGLQ